MKKILVKKQEGSTLIKPILGTYDPESNPPRFSLKFMLGDKDFSFDGLDDNHKLAFANKINTLSKLTWSDLRISGRHGLGYEKIERSALKFFLPCDIPADRNIIAFRFCGMAPMLGYRSAYGTFYIIAFDSKFIAYKH